jgi:SAM-dependent methyltransferase
MAPIEPPRPPPVFAEFQSLFPRGGRALELACGRGRSAVWLAANGMDVLGIDVSPVAVDLARRLASHHDLDDTCRFEVFDLDHGLPPGPQVDLILCHLFRDSALDQPLLQRLAPGGMVAIATLSEVDAGPGQFRVRPGELPDAFASLETLAAGEGDGLAWIIARRPK